MPPAPPPGTSPTNAPSRSRPAWRRLTGRWLDASLGPSVARQLQKARSDGWSPDTPADYCPRCGASSPSEATEASPHDGCAGCREHPAPPWTRVVRLGPYEGPLGGWVREMKYRRVWSWAAELGAMLADAAPPPTAGREHLVTWVPLHRGRRVRRGFDQARLLAEALAKPRGWPVLGLLKRTRATPMQARTLPRNRAWNLAGAFEALPIDLRNTEVLLVDDVRTSGATLTAATRPLLARGAASVRVAVVAVTDLHDR